ncbi:MAG: transcriptional regulator containing an amidase domain and an AraC-type DNA-binding domain [Proteobacteria bacterium]|nr:transcriptional regulator containing an amidase domain and an AraC-type DNA-binding domain [Pseudomonadota bacterium]
MPTHVVAVLAFDRISAFHLSVPCVVFGEAHPGMPPISLRVCAVDRSPLRTSSGFSLNVEHGLEAIAPAELLAALVAAHLRGADIVGLCLGAYVLAEAGLLDGRRATTHWECAADFARRYPQVRLDPAVLYVEDGQLTTSAGTAAGIDCCLHLLRRDYGSRVANAVARRLVVSPHRQGGQAQFVEQPLPANTRDSRLGDLLDRVRASLDRPHTLDSLAAQSLMSRRTFTRHFRQLTGNTVGAWLLGERLARSQQLLEAADHTVEQVASLAGFGSAASLRQHFQRAFGITPSAWRQGFRGN